MKNVLAFITIAVLSVFTFASCGDDEGSALVGTWRDSSRTMILHDDGTGEFLYDDYEWGDSERYFTWEATDTMFILDRGDWGVRSSYIYQLEDNVLTLIDSADGSITTYVRQ